MQSANGFDLERELVRVLEAQSIAALNLSARWHRMLSEVTIRSRIADLVVIHAPRQPQSKRARVTYFEAAILAMLLQHGASDLDAVADRLYSTALSVETRAKKLAQLGLLAFGSEGNMHPTGRHLPYDVGVIAIEAKLTRWRDAIAQAADYRGFANQSYIALPASVFERSNAILSECQDAGIGAMSVGPNGAISIPLEAPWVSPHSAEFVRFVSSEVGVAHDSKVFDHTA